MEELIEEVIDMSEEEPVLDPEEVITEDFGVICKQDGEVTAYGFWAGTRANVQRLEEWAEFGYEKTSDKYVQGYDGKWYVEGYTPKRPQEDINAERIAKLEAYLASTDWYAIRESETGIDIPADIKQARADARTEISTLRGDI